MCSASSLAELISVRDGLANVRFSNSSKFTQWQRVRSPHYCIREKSMQNLTGNTNTRNTFIHLLYKIQMTKRSCK